jgi:hypothetical protein
MFLGEMGSMEEILELVAVAVAVVLVLVVLEDVLLLNIKR